MAWLGRCKRVGSFRCFEAFCFILLPQPLFLIGLTLAEYVVVIVLGETASGAGGEIAAEGLAKSERARQETFLQQHRHDVSPRLGAVEVGALCDDLIE